MNHTLPSCSPTSEHLPLPPAYSAPDMLSAPSPLSSAASDLSPSPSSPSPSLPTDSSSPSPFNTPLDNNHELLPPMSPTDRPCRPPYRSPRSRGCPESYIRRPRNAFIIFRCEMCKGNRISSTIETDHRRLSQIIAACWNSLTPEQRQPWLDKAAQEKEAHRRRHPGYRFSPQTRTSPAKKRRTRNNGPKDKERDKQVGVALAAGLQGPELEDVVKQIDATMTVPNMAFSNTSSTSTVFRNLLLPPIDLPSRHTGSVMRKRHEPLSAGPELPYAPPSLVSASVNQYARSVGQTAAERMYGANMGVSYTPIYATMAWNQTGIVHPSRHSDTSALGLSFQTSEVRSSTADGAMYNAVTETMSCIPQAGMDRPSDLLGHADLSLDASVVGSHTHVSTYNDSAPHALYRPYVSRQPEGPSTSSSTSTGRGWAGPAQGEYVGSVRRTQGSLSDGGVMGTSRGIHMS